MVVVTYDEFGGQWDHVPPPGQGGTPGAARQMGPGTRIPALVIAPGLRDDFVVDHVQHDTTSILATIEHRFGLRAGDARATPRSTTCRACSPHASRTGATSVTATAARPRGAPAVRRVTYGGRRPRGDACRRAGAYPRRDGRLAAAQSRMGRCPDGHRGRGRAGGHHRPGLPRRGPGSDRLPVLRGRRPGLRGAAPVAGRDLRARHRGDRGLRRHGPARRPALRRELLRRAEPRRAAPDARLAAVDGRRGRRPVRRQLGGPRLLGAPHPRRPAAARHAQARRRRGARAAPAGGDARGAREPGRAGDAAARGRGAPAHRARGPRRRRARAGDDHAARGRRRPPGRS